MKKSHGGGARSSTLLSGAATLGAAAIVSKLLGTLQKIPLQNIAGDEVFGIYNAVYPLYVLVLFLATAGFPVAVSKFVSERVARGEEDEADRVLRLSAGLLMGLGAIAFFFLFFGAERIAAWVDNAHVSPAIRSVAFAFLFVPVMAALRGYFQGRQNMLPTGVSQVGEQAVRVATMIGLLLWLTGSGYSDDWVAAGATFGSVTGAAAGLAIMVAYFMRDRRERKRERAVEQGAPETGATVDRAAGEGMGLEGHASAANPTAGASSERAASRTSAAIAESVSKKRVSNAALLRQLAWFALPVCLGAIVVPVLNIVDTFTIPRLLKQQGMTESVAMAQFGIYSRGLPLVQLVSMLFSSVSVALVPAFSEAKTLGQHALLRKRAELILRMTWLIGLAASVGLALTALPVNVMLYTDRSGTTTMMLLAFTAVPSAINIMTASMLQGLGRVRTPALNLLAAVAVKSVFNAVWVPVWGVNGAAAAAVVAFSIAALLNVISLARAATFRPRWTNYMFRPLLPLGAMVLYLLLIAHGLEALLTDAFGSLSRASYTALGLISVVGGGLIYIFTLFRFGGIAKEELRTFSQLARKNLNK